MTPQDRELERAILALLTGRGAHATADPDDAARAIGGDAWRNLREPARRAARRLVAAGDAELLQDGRVVDPSSVRGPFRIRRS